MDQQMLLRNTAWRWSAKDFNFCSIGLLRIRENEDENTLLTRWSFIDKDRS